MFRTGLSQFAPQLSPAACGLLESRGILLVSFTEESVRCPDLCLRMLRSQLLAHTKDTSSPKKSFPSEYQQRSTWCLNDIFQVIASNGNWPDFWFLLVVYRHLMMYVFHSDLNRHLYMEGCQFSTKITWQTFQLVL